MKNKTLFTFAEYAEIRGITKQRVYQLEKSTLKPFVKEIKGRKFVDISEFTEEMKAEFEKDFNQFEQAPLTNLNQGLNKPLTNPQNEPKEEGKSQNSAEIDAIRQNLEFLQSQLLAKDKQIEELQRANAEKDKHIQEQSKELTRLLSQSQELQRNNQLLLAQRAQGTAEQDNQEQEIIEEVEEKTANQPKKRGLWAWLFGE